MKDELVVPYYTRLHYYTLCKSYGRGKTEKIDWEGNKFREQKVINFVSWYYWDEEIISFESLPSVHAHMSHIWSAS